MAGQAEVTIERFEPQTATDADLRARYEFDLVIESELDPDTPNWPFDAWVRDFSVKSAFEDKLRWVVWNEDRSAIVAAAVLHLGRSGDNMHLAEFDISVLPTWRRTGLGRRLLGEIALEAEADGRSVLGSGTVQGHEAEKFLAANTMSQKLLDRRSRCPLAPIPQTLLDDWIATGETKGAAGGYVLRWFEEPVPADYRERFIDMVHTMNDAPRDELDMEDWKFTEDQLADDERRHAESGKRNWFMVVEHEPTGEFVSFTGIGWNEAVPQILWQGGTAVRPAHRGHAIGRWIKAAMIQKIRTEKPEADFIDTWNAGSNKWMLAINDDLGFSPYIWYTAWQGQTADIRAALTAK